MTDNEKVAIFPIKCRWINYNEVFVIFSDICKKRVFKLNRNNIARITNNYVISSRVGGNTCKNDNYFYVTCFYE